MREYIQDVDIRYFKGNPLETAAGVSAWLITLLFPSILLVFGLWKAALMVLVLFSLIAFLPIAASLNYFGVSPYYLEVRNHYLLWKRRKIYFEDMQEIYLEKWGNNNCVTVLLRNDKKKKFSGLTLNAAHWIALKQELASRNIPVTDKNNFEAQLDPLTKKYSRLMVQRLVLWAVCTIPFSYLITVWEPETSTGTILRAVVVLAVVVVSMIVMRKTIRITSRQYEQEKKERDNSGVV